MWQKIAKYTSMSSQDAAHCSWLTWTPLVNCFREGFMVFVYCHRSQNCRARSGEVQWCYVSLSLPISLRVWPAGSGLWAIRSKVSKAGVKDTAHLVDEHSHVEAATFGQGGTKQVFCSGNLWRRTFFFLFMSLLTLPCFPSLLSLELESITTEAKEKRTLPFYLPSVLLGL